MKLSENAMLVRLNISQWTARKEDKTATRRVETDFNCKDAGRFNKALIAQEEIKKIQKIANEARIFHYTNTLPYSDDGARILPTSNYFDYTQKLQALKYTFEKAAETFLVNYPAFIEEAKARLNGLFNQMDYPPAGKIDKKYSFSTQFDPIPETLEGIRKELDSIQQGEIDQLNSDLEARIKANIAAANKDLWTRLFETVKHVSDRLHDKDAIFRDSLINNIIELVKLLPRLNITDDPNLETMRKEIEARLCSIRPEAIREDEQTRKDTARTADDILKSMTGYLAPVTEAI